MFGLKTFLANTALCFFFGAVGGMAFGFLVDAGDDDDVLQTDSVHFMGLHVVCMKNTSACSCYTMSKDANKYVKIECPGDEAKEEKQ